MRLPSQPPPPFLLLLRIIYVSTASKNVVLSFRGRDAAGNSFQNFSFCDPLCFSPFETWLATSCSFRFGQLLRLSLLRTRGKVLWNRTFACRKIVEEIYSFLCFVCHVQSCRKSIAEKNRIRRIGESCRSAFVFRESGNLVDRRSAGRLLRSVAETRTTVFIFRARRKRESHRQVRRVR